MATKKDPAVGVVTYFETASLESATVVLHICKGILTRRKERPIVPRLKRAAPAVDPTAKASA